MIDMMDIGIENATAFRMSGKLTKSEVSLVLSDMKEKIEVYGNIVIYLELESFKGIELAAVVDEFKYLFDVGICNVTRNITREVLVTDKRWLEKLVKLEDRIFKEVEIKYFSTEERELAIEFLKNP